MTHIEASKEIIQEFEALKKELKEVYPGKELNNDEVLGAMIAGFFDSLAHMKGQAGHHHAHGGGGCCGGEEEKDECCNDEMPKKGHKNEPDECCGGGCGCD